MGDALYLGIDGGGTTSRARLTDASGRILAEAIAGSSNLTLGIETASVAIREATERVLGEAGLPAATTARTHAGLGLAGANVPSLARGMREARLGFASMAVESDATIACLGAHGGHDGAILILGTGSQGLAIVGGKATTVGGWGFAISDDGSGAILGRAALRAAILAVDGLAPTTPFCAAVMTRFEGDPAAAVLWAKAATPKDYGAIAPLVFDHGRTGDPVARRLIRASADAVEAMLDRLITLGAQRIALMGGMAEPQRPSIDKRFAPFLVTPRGDAMAGALVLARNGALS